MITTLRRVRLFAAALAFSVALLAPTARCLAETKEAVTAPSAAVSSATVSPETAPPVVVAARGGRDLIAAAETSKVVVVGRFSAIEKIDLHGYAADFRIDQAFVGPFKAGLVLRVAWEELAASRPVRFVDGGRALLCLDAPPAYTLWQKRFPDNFGDILAVTRDGEAFWRDPDSQTLHLLEHYLALGNAGHDDPAGLAYLVDMVADAHELVAAQALARLAEQKNLAGRLSESSIDVLVKAAAGDRQVIAVRRGVLGLIGRAEIKAARDGIEPIALTAGPLRAEALLVLGELDGTLPQAMVAQLLVDENGELRAVAALYLQGDDATTVLVRMATTDPAPAVRVAAVHRLLGEHGQEVFDEIAPVLGDEDAAVRAVVARDIAKLGDPIVPALEKLAETGTERQGQGVVLTLTMIGGDDAGKALVRLYHGHENPSVRGIAGLALGHISSGDEH